MNFRDWLVHRLLARPYRLHAVDYGGNKPVVILLHGLGTSSASWDLVIPLLKDDYRCITIDLLGFGESPKPDWSQYQVRQHIAAISLTIKHLKLRGRFTLVGHSLGGLLAVRYARLHPYRLQRVVLLSPPVYVHPEVVLKRLDKQRTSMYLAAYKFIRTHKRMTPANVARLAKLLPATKSLIITEQTWLPFVRTLEQCIENQTIASDIARVTRPVDVLYGVFDQVIVPRNLRLLKVGPHVSLRQLPVDHAIGKRYSAAIAAHLLDVRTL